jgi:hypothetical protein
LPASPVLSLTPGRLIAVVVALALVARLALVLSADPYLTPDSRAYMRVAENIYANFCVSRSDPAGGECAPLWGAGNQPPGYPVFIAAAWAIGGKSPLPVLILQSIAASAAIGWLAWSILVLLRRRDMAIAVGCVLALSPLEIGFSRAVLTEGLATSATLWVLAELFLSLAEGRLRLLPLGVALAAAMFIRFDGILLCLLAAGIAFHLHPAGLALRRGAVLALIVLAPIAGWTLRSMAVGLPALPAFTTAEHDWAAPAGPFQWAASWIETPEQAAEFLNPMMEASYRKARVPPTAYAMPDERQRVENLLARLAAYDGKPVPADVNQAFLALAAERRAGHPLTIYLLRPMVRSFAIWSDPYSSFAWPIGFGTAAALEIAHTINRDGLPGLLAMTAKYPLQAAGKILVNGYRIAIVIGFLLAILVARREPALRPIIVLTGAYAVIRTVFFTAIFVPGVEIRFIVEALPGLEIACALAAVAWLLPRAQSVKPARFIQA